ncbi:macro domain-containing protein [Armatimonas rosea]|uniref:O-acetyl-ADP-ribose deacetylase (Regulator of RNase III) n=1 Tax=Armatimonas rosea TaxID=685828 RepID=A0A7W9STN9_ARMRO|nr:macro domain-containing protein [Armatimonas rosea]MBB6051764.1 O-acetyl-ADP-ribose deacetylase (regulator of RNase III) [Armatimonas rosea]
MTTATQLGKTRFELIEGDIAEQTTEAVVTAAHWDLGGGQGTDGAIHFKAGPELLALCRTIGACPIGGAVLTPGFRLKAPWVVHAVGPVYETGDEIECDLLGSAYRESLRLAADSGLTTLSFPSIGTGAFNWPLRAAAPLALAAIRDFLLHEEHTFTLVRLVLYPDEQPQALGIYADALERLA